MSKLRSAGVFVVLVATLSLLSSPATASAAPVRAIVKKINSTREANDLRPLRLSSSLMGSSGRFARRLMRQGHFRHAARVQASGRFAAVGEALAFDRGWRARGRRAVQRWLGSAVHRPILLGNFSYVGVGAVRGVYRGRRATIWVVQVGRM